MWLRRLAWLPLLLTFGCATYFPLNQPLERWAPVAPPEASEPGVARSDDLFLVLAFSGGGTRASALAYGVLQELAATPIEIAGRSRRLLDEVDLISSVSGGSFTAAYYGLHGDRIFTDFESRFLRRNIQLAMFGQLFRPRNWPRLFSTYFSRTELAAEYFDARLFEGASFADLDRAGPEILINATDLSRGIPFTFSREHFDLICSELDSFPVARAVAASSAVPVLLSPVILRNRAGRCGYPMPDWVAPALAERGGSTRSRARARGLVSYLDSSRRRFIHLLDGGVSDNLGVRPVIDLAQNGLGAASQRLGRARNIVIITVNAQKRPSERWDAIDIAPPLAAVLDAVTDVQISRYNFETLELVRAGFEAAARDLSRPGRPVGFHLVEVSFEAVDDPALYRALNDVPTGLHLPDADVDRVVRAGRDVLRASDAFRVLLGTLEASPPTPAP